MAHLDVILRKFINCRMSCQDAKFEVFTAMTFKITIFCDVTPYSEEDSYWHLKETWCCHLQGKRVVSLCTSLRKMEAISSSETSVTICQTKWRHTPDNSNLYYR
jgi:hypothetical protein